LIVLSVRVEGFGKAVAAVEIIAFVTVEGVERNGGRLARRTAVAYSPR
jgi:hypothetical protein